MNAVEPIEEDGNLPDALQHLGESVSKLIDPKPEMVEDKVHWTDSLYEQLCGEVPGSQGNRSRVPQSSPPLCLDAAELKSEIDTAIGIWEPRPTIDVSTDPPPMTVIRLQAIEKRKWRPQDVRGIEQITAAVESWCESIKNLLNPAPKWHLPNPCPACDKAVVYRKNSAGEVVRQPALQIGAAGCVCQSCHHTWAPEYFQHLASVLGYKLPDGVLE